MKRNKLKAQSLVEYLLIFAMVALVSYGFVSHFNFVTLRNYVFNRPASTTSGATTITIEPMTK